MEKLKLCHLFSGVGAPEMALKRAGIDFEIAGYSEIDKFAIKSYEAIHGKQNYLGGIESVEELPKCDLLVYGSPCLTGDTYVLTQEGHKFIKDTQAGELVLGHDGKFHEVEALLDQGVKPTYCVEGFGFDQIRCTGNHKFYARKRTYKWDNNKKRTVRMFGEPEWTPCIQLDSTYYVGMPVLNTSKFPDWGGVEYIKGKHFYNHNELPLDNPDFWYIVGRYIGDGWTRKRAERRNATSTVIICCGKSELEELKAKLSLFHHTITEERTVYKFTICNKEFAMFLEQFGHKAHGKKVPGFVLDLPTNLLTPFVDGYMDSDGYINKHNNYKGSSVSRELIYGLATCISKAYLRPVSIYYTKRSPKCIIEGREVNQRDTYSFKFHKETRKQDKAFYEDGYVWYPIRKVTETGLNEQVYDLVVADSHSFVANNCVVHNCTDFSIGGAMKGLVDENGNKTRSGLLLDVERLLDIAKEKDALPKILIMENVKNLVGTKFKPDFLRWLDKLNELGYDNYWKVLNAKDFGVPQNRERVFVVSIRKDLNIEYEFPQPFELKKRIKDIMETDVPEHYYLNQHTLDKIAKSKFHSERDRIIKGDVCQTLRARDYKDPVCVQEPVCGASRGRYVTDEDGNVRTEQQLELNGTSISNTLTTVQTDSLIIEPKQTVDPRVQQIANYLEGEGGYWKNPNNGRIYSREGLSPTLNCMEGGNRQPKIVEGDEEFQQPFRVRKLTERECWRLMGFSDEDVDKVKEAGISRSQMYKQAGNSIVVDVLCNIFKTLPLDKI